MKPEQSYSGPDNTTDKHYMELRLKKVFVKINDSKIQSGKIDTEDIYLV